MNSGLLSGHYDPTFLSTQCLHLLGYLITPPGDPYMEPIVAAHLGVCPPPPFVIGLQQGHTLLVQHEVNCNQKYPIYITQFYIRQLLDTYTDKQVDFQVTLHQTSKLVHHIRKILSSWSSKFLIHVDQARS